MMSWCLMSSDVIWHIRDKLWPTPKHGSIKATYVRCMRVLAVTCHLHFWQNDRDFLRATVVTRGWNGYRNKSLHRKSTLEKKIPPPPPPRPFQQGFEPTTFQSRVRRSNHWAIPAPSCSQRALILVLEHVGNFGVRLPPGCSRHGVSVHCLGVQILSFYASRWPVLLFCWYVASMLCCHCWMFSLSDALPMQSYPLWVLSSVWPCRSLCGITYLFSSLQTYFSIWNR